MYILQYFIKYDFFDINSILCQLLELIFLPPGNEWRVGPMVLCQMISDSYYSNSISSNFNIPSCSLREYMWRVGPMVLW